MSNKFFVAFVSLVLLCSCDSEVNQGDFWGVSEAYESFLWCRHEPDTLRKTLVFEFNDDARRLLDRPVILGLFKKEIDSEGVEKVVPLSTDQVRLFVDCTASPDNTFKVTKDTEELDLALVFPGMESTKVHTWYIRVIDNGGLDNVNGYEVAASDCPIVKDVQVKTIKRANPLAVGFVTALIVIIGAFLLWMLLIRYMVYPRFKVALAYVGKGDATPTPVRIKKYIKFIITSGSKRQSAISAFFTGPVRYFPMSEDDGVVDGHDIVLVPFDEKSVRFEKDRNAPYTMTVSRLRIKTVGKPSDSADVINAAAKKTIKIKIQ